MSQTKTVFNGVVHGRIIELEDESGLPDGQPVRVEIVLSEERAGWWKRFVMDPSVASGKLIVKGTRLIADELVQRVVEGLSDEELIRQYAELSAEDVAAIREYARVPAGLRQSFGAWEDDPEGLEEYLEWNRRQRKQNRPEINP